jgi:hypothetical protein
MNLSPRPCPLIHNRLQFFHARPFALPIFLPRLTLENISLLIIDIPAVFL